MVQTVGMKNKVIIITGLTGSGKSSLATETAKVFNGEIISADSVQVYRGLDIGSAKVDKTTQNIVKHHLIDIKNFNENYNVGEFLADCEKTLKNITLRKKLPIIVGGTGLYIKALMDGYCLGGTNAHLDFRENYIQLAKEKGNEYVWNELNKIDSNMAAAVHPNNIKRVVRYLEIAKFGKIAVSDSILKNFDVLALAIVEDRETIYEKINSRVDKMIACGLEKEVKSLINLGAKNNMQSMQAIGYKEWFNYFNRKNDLKTTINYIKQHTRNYCKRQLTFLKTIKGIEFCSLNDAKSKIKEFLC